MPNTIVAGLDIGGTKCAVSIGRVEGDAIQVLEKRAFPTPDGPDAAIQAMIVRLRALMERGGHRPQAIGISCGGPLDSKKGLILEPPNLPGWAEVPIVQRVREAFGVPTRLQNDANACAVAEWKFGAGRGLDSLVFLTFGTGMGAGLILDGRLYSGGSDAAGEVGHIRLDRFGPWGFGKHGSFEGFCSGGGMAHLAGMRAREAADRNALSPAMRALMPDGFSAKALGEAADAGDAFALAIFEEVGERLGQGVAILIDLLNPQAVVIGSIYARQRERLEGPMRRALERECLPVSLAHCQVLPAALGESVGDYAALSVALLEE